MTDVVAELERGSEAGGEVAVVVVVQAAEMDDGVVQCGAGGTRQRSQCSVACREYEVGKVEGGK